MTRFDANGTLRADVQRSETKSEPFWNTFVKAQREMFMPDGLHPNDAGYARIAERITAFLHNL